MKKKLLVSLLLALSLCLVSIMALAAADPLYHLTFDSEEALERDGVILNGGAVLEDGVVKLPGGAHRSAYVELPYGALIDTTDQVSISTWMYMSSASPANGYFVAFANGNSWPGFVGRVLPGGQVAVNFDNRGILMTEPCVPMDAWVHVTLTVSRTSMCLYLNGERVARYDGAEGVEENCGWYRINGADVGTTHYHELDKVSLPAGWLGTPPYNFYYELDGDMAGMFDDYRIYDVALSGEEVAELYKSLICPSAAFPIGAPANPGQTAAEMKVAAAPADGLRVLYTFDSADEGYILHGGAAVENGVLTLPGGAFREAGHMELPRYAIANCVTAMTVSTWINVDSFDIGDQFIFSISDDDGWPAMYFMTWGDGTMHYNIDYRSMLNTDSSLPAGRWCYLTAVICEDEVAVYVDGQQVSRYDRRAIATTGGSWEMLNVQNDFTQYNQIDRVANNTFRVGSAFMDVGYNRVDARAQFDNFRVYSKPLTAEEVSALYAQECAATEYAR